MSCRTFPGSNQVCIETRMPLVPLIRPNYFAIFGLQQAKGIRASRHFRATIPRRSVHRLRISNRYMWVCRLVPLLQGRSPRVARP